MAKTISKSKQAYYTQYKNTSRWAANRKRKLERQLKLQPGNEDQIKAAIGNVSYRRATPKGRVWAHSHRRIAQLFKEFAGYAPQALFSSNPKVQSAALQYHNPERKFIGLPEGKVSFSIGARAHDKQGNLVWS